MSHLDLEDTASYRRWVEFKHASYALREAADFPLILNIKANGCIPDTSRVLIEDHIRRYNFALYRIQGHIDDHLAAVKRIGQQVGLKALDKNLCAREDRITQLSVAQQGRARHYIPYSNRAISWHTDGYYNPMHQRVQAFVLHCQQPAASGGENALVDPDMAYIHLRDENPEYIRTLSRPEVMCIPGNVENGVEIRPQTCSAVFMEEQDHALAMRFSQRKRHIIWADDPVTQEALDCLSTFLDSDSPYHIHYRLNAGEGIINNNVLHMRTAFEDSEDSQRVFYRARYYNRIQVPQINVGND